MRDPFKLYVFPSASMVVKADDHILRVPCDVDDLFGRVEPQHDSGKDAEPFLISAFYSTITDDLRVARY